MPRTTSTGGIDYMALGLAARPLIHSTDAAPVAFATLVGPVAAPSRWTPKDEQDILATVVHGLLEERGQSIRLTCPAQSTLATADSARVIQVIANLLSNASRYSVEGDEIELSISTVGQQLRIRVSDHGPGISPEDQQRIFSAWVRGQSGYSGGLGLGLSIVQQQGGRVGVESTLGHGATFWFTLPV